MPEISRTKVENRIKECNPGIRPSDLKKAAKLHMRRHEAHTRVPTYEESLILAKAITYADPTGEQAARNADIGVAA